MTLKLKGTSELQKSGEIRVKKEVLEKLGWEAKDVLVLFIDEKKNALVIRSIKEVVR